MVLSQFTCPIHPPPTFWLVPENPQPALETGDGFFVIRLGDTGLCGGIIKDVVIQGSKKKIVCGLPVARVGDKMHHGGVIIMPGSPTMDDDGDTFSLPANIWIDGSEPGFVSKAIRDFYFLSTTKTGEEILKRIAATGQWITIKKLGVDGNTHSFTRPDDLTKLNTGTKMGSTVQYDPDNCEVFVEGTPGGWVGMPPQLALGHELLHALRFATGKGTSNTIEEDKHVIGPPYGPKPLDPDTPTENGLRNDLRKDYPLLGTRTGYRGNVEDYRTKNLRPGD
jgi:hypothetical protein